MKVILTLFLLMINVKNLVLDSTVSPNVSQIWFPFLGLDLNFVPRVTLVNLESRCSVYHFASQILAEIIALS